MIEDVFYLSRGAHSFGLVQDFCEKFGRGDERDISLKLLLVTQNRAGGFPDFLAQAQTLDGHLQVEKISHNCTFL